MSSGLSDEDRARLETLFERAADLAPEDHASFVENECGDSPALRDALRNLLAGLVGEDLLQRIRPLVPTRVGETIGPYELLERIGSGGMGEVYAARQHAPVERRVALKLIKVGMDSAQVVARFEAERQALARMNHPNIARIFDGGATPDGRPYFVMELVEGAPITHHCDALKLSTRARLELFLQVCEGVHHAHQKGVIHRDLKPSNLLVMQQDGRAVPKVIDFGVARATSGRLSDHSAQTVFGQLVGTLDYMSPEQADPGGTDIDTRSDIYTLGVVLYQLVTGLLPFEQRAGELPLSELQRRLREKDPPTPSTRLRRSAHAATASLHGTDERSLVRQVSGDVDWICLKALEKDPARRYASASELAADLRRHLEHRPVLAGRPGTLYRARKFVRRNRVGVAAAALVILGLAAGSFGIASGRMDAEASARVADALLPQADAYRLTQLLEDSRQLWPAYPATIPALEAWGERADELLQRLPKHAAELAGLRSRALPWSLEEAARDRETHPRANELAGMQAELAALSGRLESESFRNPNQAREAASRVEELQPAVTALVAEVGRRRSWSFASESDAGLHAALGPLVERLEALNEHIHDVEHVSAEQGWGLPKRLAFARELEATFAPGGAYATAWAEALPAIRAAYPGLEIRPQTALLPLGPDPVSGLWEFAHLPSGAPAVREADGRLVLVEETGLVLVLLPAATYWMGAQWDDPTAVNYDPEAKTGNREGPPVEVDVDAFFVSKYELTQAQWTRASGSNPSLYQFGMVKPMPMNPVNQVTWPECAEVVRRLGLGLPTEEQWEYAARGGTTTTWWTGTDAEAVAKAENLLGGEDGARAITAVGSFRANPFGLHDVLGNVSEWCANPPYVLGTPPGSSPETLRMRAVRGGSARLTANIARSALRNPARTGMDDASLGLRPVRAIGR